LIGQNQDLMSLLTRHSAIVILIAIVIIFGLAAPAFFSVDSLSNTIKQASFIGIAAVGITFVLLTAGIDLSVGSIMYLAPLIAGLAMRDHQVGVVGAMVIAVGAGALMGGINAFLIVGLRIIPFIATLATLFLFRGFGAFLTSSRQLDFPDSMRQFGLSQVLGIPLPVIIFAIVAIVCHFCLRSTVFGRQIYALGNNPEGARKAGLPVRRLQASVYVISGVCAALAGFVLVSQIGRLDAGFGEGREFSVIAAAVLGGASLFGGTGSALSAVIGATTIQVVSAGLVYTGVNLYLQPVLQGLIIFLAVFLDGFRQLRMETMRRRIIRPLTTRGN
jgi:ribose/xylose/arabinose/galactoside ABC-type transport system permease subunit